TILDLSALFCNATIAACCAAFTSFASALPKTSMILSKSLSFTTFGNAVYAAALTVLFEEFSRLNICAAEFGFDRFDNTSNNANCVFSSAEPITLFTTSTVCAFFDVNNKVFKTSASLVDAVAN